MQSNTQQLSPNFLYKIAIGLYKVTQEYCFTAFKKSKTMNLYNKLSFAFKMLTFHGNVLRGSIFVEQLERCNIVLYMQCNQIKTEHCFFISVYI